MDAAGQLPPVVGVHLPALAQAPSPELWKKFAGQELATLGCLVPGEQKGRVRFCRATLSLGETALVRQATGWASCRPRLRSGWGGYPIALGLPVGGWESIWCELLAVFGRGGGSRGCVSGGADTFPRPSKRAGACVAVGGLLGRCRCGLGRPGWQLGITAVQHVRARPLALPQEGCLPCRRRPPAVGLAVLREPRENSPLQS